jgi:predicted DNA-binding protein YlxM (UPF0122 family)
METREISIYNLLYEKLYTKKELADIFNVTTKTIENTIKKCDDIAYSKKLGSYYFPKLLPKYISYKNFFSLFKDSVTNPIIKKDFSKISSSMKNKFNNIMIDTEKLSELSKKIIKANIAINHNCLLKVEYIGNKKAKEKKYIQPRQIFTSGSIYYLLIKYDEKNKKNIGEERQLAFNGIESIEPVEYQNDQKFKIKENDVNAFGSFKNTKTIKLILKNEAANFFKREGLFETNNFKFLSEITTQSIAIEMKYNHKLEVIKLVQQWLPLITISDSSEDAKNIINDIKTNYQKFIESL